jgi:septum formation protein
MVLASLSPRRRRLLELLALPFVSTAVDTPEDLDTPLAADPIGLACSLAAEKAVAARAKGLGASGLVLCFDTIVVLDGAVLGKPVDVSDAWRMLRALSARSHLVVTGAAILAPGLDTPRTFAVATDVTMRKLEDTAIEKWMTQGTFLGCAGAYNIEAQIAEVRPCDCYQNVAGLPLCHVYAELIGNEVLEAWLPARPTSPVAACNAALARSCELGPRVVANGTSSA